ncbi:MAG: ComEC/Rec2 family competence protein [Gemmatimonadota bacterium]
MTPLLLATLAYATGLLAGLRAPLPVAFGLVLLGFAVLLLNLGWRRSIALSFCAAGLLAGGLRRNAVLADCRQHLPDGAVLRIAGVPPVLPTEGVSIPFDAVIEIIQEGDVAGSACRGLIRARAPARLLPALDSAARGTSPPILARARWLAYPERSGWPRRADFAGSALIDALEPRPDSMAAVPRAGPVRRFRTAQQARLRALLPERWGFAEALLLAQTSGLSPETRNTWVAAGLVHLLAISGMHVGLIAGAVLALAAACGTGPRTARRIAVLVTACYVLFLGAPSAALRALLQATLLLCSVELQRPTQPFTALSCAALVILMIEPLAVLDPGFQLSFAGMIGLVAWRRPVAELLPTALHRYLRDGIAAGVSASALTTPVAALHFGTASWIGVPATLIAAPLLGFAVGALLVALLVAALTGITAGPHALVADVPLRLLDLVAELAAGVPAGHGYMAASTVMACLAAAAAALLARRALVGSEPPLPPPSHAPAHIHERWSRRHRLRRLRVAAAAAAAVAAIAWTPLLLQPRDGRVEIHAIDVGQGDAFAIRTPANRWLLVDAGPRSMRFDAGRDRVVPYLLKHGVRRLDAMILTHPDADHIGGAAAVLEVFDVATVIDPGFAAGKDLFIDLIAAARRTDSRWIAAREGITLRLDGVEVSILFPLSALDAAADANDTSVVFRLVFGAFSALFLGDAPTSVEERLIARHGDRLRTTLLKVGHHGSNTSTGEVLLAAIRPSVAVVSAGRNNRYGHPAPAVLRRLAEHEVRVLRTDVHGNITIRATRSGTLEMLAR